MEIALAAGVMSGKCRKDEIFSSTDVEFLQQAHDARQIWKSGLAREPTSTPKHKGPPLASLSTFTPQIARNIPDGA